MSVEMLQCFPRDDRAFRALAEALLTSSGTDDPGVLQEHLRRTYPNSVVWRQHALAVLSDARAVWYVYRDGHYVTPSEAAEEMAAPVDAA